jgi:hypothetical protein
VDQGGIRLVDERGQNGNDDTMEILLNNSRTEDSTITQSRINFVAGDYNNNEYTDVDLTNSTSPDDPMEIGGSFVAYPEGNRVTLAGNGQVTPIELEFIEGRGGNVQLSDVDFFVITIAYSNGETDTYFVAP